MTTDIEKIREKFEELAFITAAAAWNGERYVPTNPDDHYSVASAISRQFTFERYKEGYLQAVKAMDQSLAMHAVSHVLDNCGNSYSNAYTEKWLTKAKEMGVYHGPVTGKIQDIKNEWEAWLSENGCLPDL